MPTFRLGLSDRECVAVEVTGISADDPDEWVSVQISIQAGGFTGAFAASFTSPELHAFRDALRALHASLSGTARFATLEGQLELTLTGDGRGGIDVRGAAIDSPGSGNRLEFTQSLDQTYLADSVRQLDEVCSALRS